eukprot:5530716-Ditylum_brightwellii.AAC.1
MAFMLLYTQPLSVFFINALDRDPSTIVVQGWDHNKVFFTVRWQIHSPGETEEEAVVPKHHVRKIIIM